MPGEDQERVEDYLELERYIEELQAGHAAQLPEHLTPEQARVYRMAALFHSASPEAIEPQPAFAAQLEARLLARLQGASQNDITASSSTDEEQHRPLVPSVSSQPTEVATSGHAGEQQLLSKERGDRPRTRARLSRRNVLAGAASVAASLGIGAGVGYTIERTVNTGDAATIGDKTTAVVNKFVWDPKTPLVGNVPTTWLEVTSLAQLGNGAVRFVTDALAGYVVHLTASDEIIAVSAACTHMGCLVQWQHADRRFHCPCHSGLFEASGEQVNSPGYAHYLAPLPRLRTKVENGHVYVEVPVKQQL